MEEAIPNTPLQALRVAIFFDGNNWFYSMVEYLRSVRGGRVDYPALVDWIVGNLRVKLGLPEDAPVHAETWYFTGVPEDDPAVRENVLGFLLAIERAGIRVERLPMRKCLVTCQHCAGTLIRFEEQQVDVALGVKLAWLATRHVIDVAVLVSRDGDFTPAVVTAQDEGTRVYVAAISLPEISRELARSATGLMDMSEGLHLSMRSPPQDVHEEV